MQNREFFLNKCVKIARLGKGNVSPNPMVGSVIVCKGEVIGEGYHEKYGSHHAEVNAINSVKDKFLLSKSTLYVNLEPCSHFGKTPPCSDFIIKHKIPKVVIGCMDTYSEVDGTGIEKMKNAGIDVKIGIMEKESRDLNKRFFTFHEKKRPYIILKWAENKDGFIAPENQTEPFWMTSSKSKILVHKWRSEEDSILVGRITAEKDNPYLTVREVQGENPIRIVIDKDLKLSTDLNLFDSDAKTIIFNTLKTQEISNNYFIKINFNNLIKNILQELHKQNIQSIIIEGGSNTLQSFIDVKLWDEARIFTANKELVEGLKAPIITGKTMEETEVRGDKLTYYKFLSSSEKMWEEFTSKNQIYKKKGIPESFFFCDNKKDADECSELVLKGIKQATACSLWSYKKHNRSLPKKGDLFIVTNWNGKAKAIAETTNTQQVSFNQITPEFARTEGEGDKSLTYWKKVHWDFFSREMRKHGKKPSENMIIVCEYFKIIWS